MTTGNFYCGVDIGASATKLVLLDGDRQVLARAMRHSGVDYRGTARQCLDEALKTAGLTGEPAVTVSTGYGRRNVDFAGESRTEIHCHGVGCFHHAQQAVSVVDIGGQDNKVIHLDDEGKRREFKMNRKCAAGTGAFIEEIALRLNLDVAELDALAGSTDEPVRLGSFCTVFAKTEILSHLRQGAPVEGIVRGAFVSVVDRIVEMDPLDGMVMATGGVVAHNPVIVKILASRLGRDVVVPEAPQFTGALGAALTARKLATAK
ncbi:MAG: acyl-CoA dehydratase activase [Candidatus Krumholzibacteriota bacterium]